jgi:SM-20-related protein
MPSSGFFRQLGLFVRGGFFDPAICAQLQRQMLLAESEKGLVLQGEAEGSVLNEEVRKVLDIKTDAATTDMVWEAIGGLRPILQDHFRVQLRHVERPAFLRYGCGAFYSPHTDGDITSPSVTRARLVSVVLFLNGGSQEPAPNAFGGGALTFHGLMDGQPWEKCAFALDAEPGLLIAFRSNTLHEVRPVTFGQRFTIVSWFRS